MKAMPGTLIAYFLKFLNRFLQTDTSYIARGSFWLALGKTANTLVAVLLSILYARYLLKETYGDYRYIVSVFGLLGIFALPGMITTLRRSVARGYDKMFPISARFIFFSSWIMSLAGIGIGIFFLLNDKTALAWGFIAASFIIPFVEGLGSWRGYLESKRQFEKQTIFNVISHLFYGISMATAVISIYFFNLGVQESLVILITTYFLAHALPNIVFFLKTLRAVPKDAKAEPGAVRYGIQLSIITIPTTAANYLDGILLYTLLGPVALAIYSFSIAPIEQLKAFMGTAEVVTFPKLSQQTENQKHIQNLQRFLPMKALRASLITGVIVILYVVSAPYLYHILFPNYVEAIPFSQLFAISLIFFPFGIFNSALKAEGNIKKIYLYQISVPLIQIACFAALIPFWGIWGAVIGKIIGRFSGYFLPFFLFKE